MSGEHIVFPGYGRPIELSTDNVSIIPAHSTALRAMTFSEKGDMLVRVENRFDDVLCALIAPWPSYYVAEDIYEVLRPILPPC